MAHSRQRLRRLRRSPDEEQARQRDLKGYLERQSRKPGRAVPRAQGETLAPRFASIAKQLGNAIREGDMSTVASWQRVAQRFEELGRSGEQGRDDRGPPERRRKPEKS